MAQNEAYSSPVRLVVSVRETKPDIPLLEP